MDCDPVIYVIDDDEALSDRLASILTQHDFKVVCFADATAFLTDGSVANWGCLVASVSAPGVLGEDNQAELRRRVGNLGVIFVNTCSDVPLVVQLLADSVVAVLQRPVREIDLLNAVRNGIDQSRGRYAAADMSREMQARFAQLTESERNVLNGFMDGLSRKEIASLLDLSQRSIDRRRESVLRKMGVHSLHQLIRILAAPENLQQSSDHDSI